MASCSSLGGPPSALFRVLTFAPWSFYHQHSIFHLGGMCFRASDVLPWGCPTSLCVDLEAQRTGLLLEGGTAPGSLRFSLTR